MRDCRMEPERLSLLLDGELPRAEAEQLREHLRTCDYCQTIYRRYAGLSDALFDAVREPPADLTQRIMEAVRTEAHGTVTPISAAKKRKKRSAFAPLLTTAACLAVIIGVVAVAGRPIPAATSAAPSRSQTVGTAKQPEQNEPAGADDAEDAAALLADKAVQEDRFAATLSAEEMDDVTIAAIRELLHDGERTDAPEADNEPVCILRDREEDTRIWIDSGDVIYTEDGTHYFRLPDSAEALKRILETA